jgi:capsular polysaccharide biosynthesis protein
MKENYIQEDEIDLKELFKTLWAKKIFIVVVTFFVTAVSVIYVLIKNPIPLYEGKVLVEIGEIQSSDCGISYFDTPNNLSEIIKARFFVESLIPKGTNRVLELSAVDSNKNKIEEKLVKSVEYILQRHQEKAKFYENYIMTEQVGNIVINSTPINQPKKLLIVTVAFVSGLILSVFLVFFIEFIKGFKEEKND